MHPRFFYLYSPTATIWEKMLASLSKPDPYGIW